ncbi:MAG: hypothetical protein ACM37W_25065 [Actinomycetota bacterium]
MQSHKKTNIYLEKERQTNFLTLSAIFNSWGQIFVQVTTYVMANQGANFGRNASEATVFHPLHLLQELKGMRIGRVTEQKLRDGHSSWMRRTGVTNQGGIFARTLLGFAKIANNFLNEKESLKNKPQAELLVSTSQLSQKQQPLVRSDRASPPKKMDRCGYG